MNEEALKYAHELFTKDGYSGSLDDYKKLIETNKEALDYSYKLFKKDGYTDNFDTFQGLLGVKKKGAGERTIQEYGNGSKPSQVTQTKPKVFGESITTGVEGIKKTLAESKQPFEQPKTKQIEPQVGGELEWKTDLTPSKMTTKGIMIEEKKDGGADFGLSKYVEQQTINTISETMGYSPIDVRRKLTEAPLAERTQFLYSVNNAINQKVEDTPTLFIDAEIGQYTQQRNKNKQIVAQLEKTKEYIGLELQKVKSEATKNINQFATINSQTEPNSYFNTFFNDGLQSLKATNPEQAKTIQNVLEKGIRLNDVYSYNAAYSGYISNINNIDKKINDLIKLVPTDEIKKKRDKIDIATNQQDYNTAVKEYNAFIAPYKNSIDELQKLSTLRDNVDGAWKNNYKTAFPEKYKLDEEQKLVNKEYEEGGIPTKAYYQLIAPIKAWLGETEESALGFVGNSMSALGFIDKDLYINARKRFDLSITTNLQPEIIQGLSKLDNVQHREYILNKYGKDSLVYNQQTNEYEINKQSTNAKEVEEYVGTGVNWDAIVPTMIKTTAQSYGFYSGGLLFGGKSALAKNVAQFGSVFVQSMDMNVQQAIDNGMSFDDAMIIGAMYSTIEGLSERIVPEEKIWGGLSKLSGSKLNKFYDDALNLHRLGMKGNVKQFATSMADLSIGYVKSVAPEIGEEFISQIGQAVTDTVYNKVNDANKGDIEVSPLDYKTLKNIALETIVGMTPTALLGGVGNMSTMKKVAMYSMGKEPQVYKDALKDLLESGQITKEKYDKQVQKVDTVSNIYEMLPNETTSGIKLNDDAKIELLNKYYAKSQLTAEKKVLENAGATEEDVNVIDEQIKEKSSEIVSVISTGKIEENVVEDKNILYTPLKGTPITMGDVAALEKELEDSGKTLTASEIGSKYNIGLIARQTIFDKYNNLKPKQYAVQKPTTTEEMLRPKSEGEIGQLGLQGVEQKDQSKDTSKASEAKEVAPLKIELSPIELTEEEISKLDNDQKEEYQFLVEANTPSSKDKLKDLVAQIRAEQPTVSKEQAPASRDVESYEGMFNNKKTGISGLDALLKDDGYNYFYKSVSGEVVMMSPDEYLKKVREGLKTKQDANVTKDKKDAINEAINEGNKIYMPFISTKDGKFSQEGRNRAVVAKERGEKLIPVFIEKDISFDDKIAKGQEYIKSSIKDGAKTKEEVLSKLKEQGLHRDAIHFIDNNFDDKAVESLLSKEQAPAKEESPAAEKVPAAKKNIISKPALGRHSSPYKFETFELGINEKRGKALGYGVYLAKEQESTASYFSNVSLKEGVGEFLNAVQAEAKNKGYKYGFNNPAANILSEFSKKIINENGRAIMDVTGDIEQDVRAVAEAYNKNLGPLAKMFPTQKERYATEEDINNAVEFAKKHEDKLGVAYEYEMEYETDGYIIPNTNSKVATLPKEILNAISSFSPEAKAVVNAAIKDSEATFQELYNNLVRVKGLDSPKGVSDFLDSKGIIGQNDNGQVLIYNDKKVNVISRKEISYAEKGRELKAPKPAPVDAPVAETETKPVTPALRDVESTAKAFVAKKYDGLTKQQRQKKLANDLGWSTYEEMVNDDTVDNKYARADVTENGENAGMIADIDYALNQSDFEEAQNIFDELNKKVESLLSKEQAPALRDVKSEQNSLRGVKYSDIVVGDKYLEDILSDNKLSEDEKQQVREIFSRGVDYFKFDKESEQKFQEKFSNPEDITDVADIITGLSSAQESAFDFYNTKNYDNVKDAVNYIVSNPNDYSPKVVKAVNEIKQKLDNPSSSMNRLYAIDVMKELGLKSEPLLSKEQTPPALSDVESTAKALEGKENELKLKVKDISATLKEAVVKEKERIQSLGNKATEKEIEDFFKLKEQSRQLGNVSDFGSNAIKYEEIKKDFEDVDNKIENSDAKYKKGKQIGEESFGKTYEADGDGILYRGVSKEDYERIQKQGFIDTDLRGVISEREGINLGKSPSNSANYLPNSKGGYIIAIDPKGLELFTTDADNYIRTHNNIPIKNIVKVSEFIGKDEMGAMYKQSKFNESISEVYHKAKADGSNPELVKAVESLLSKEQAPEAKKESTPKKEKTKFAEDEKRKLQPQRARDRGRRIKVRRFAPLEGAPSVQGFYGPDPRLVEVAEGYAKQNGIPFKRQSEYAKVDVDRAKRIAKEYGDMKHEPQNPKVRESYQSLIEQTKAQYQALVDAGYKFYFIDLNTKEGQDYASTPYNAMRELRNDKTMGVFSTIEGFGTDADFSPDANPLLEDTGLRWPVGPNGKEQIVLANDLFRAVHDAFGHGLEGAGFRARGEENAWQAHVRLFTGLAIGAITSETRGQNSWLNYGPYGDTNRTAKVEDTIFADQKTGLMPEWTWAEGKVGDMEEDISQEEDIMQVFDDIAEIDNEMEGKNAKELKELKQERKDILNNNPQSKFIIEKLPELRKLLKFEQQGKCR